jgi:nicotinic acid phosphoribosyltransferase
MHITGPYAAFALLWNVRNALDKRGFDFNRIVVSGRFDAEKIEQFRLQDVPVDSFGVGSSLFRDRYDSLRTSCVSRDSRCPR